MVVGVDICKKDLYDGRMSVEIYSQRYETFRHLDKLRWQLFQLLVAIFSASALVLRWTSGEIAWWFYTLLGLALVIISFSMFQVSKGIRMNSEVLKSAAEAIGDHGIPDVSNKWKSIAHWIAIIVMLAGVIMLAYPIVNAIIC